MGVSGLFHKSPFPVQIVVLLCLVVHFAIDTLKGLVSSHGAGGESTVLFLSDQVLHILTVTVTDVVLAHIHASRILHWHVTETTRLRLLVAITIYVAVLFAGGHLIRHLTRNLSSNLTGATGTESPDQLKNAGMYIGWMERCLVITAIAVQSPALVGLILTGKSIARFPEIKDARFAEYFLIGTLMSVSIAVAGGVALAWIFYGTFSLK